MKKVLSIVLVLLTCCFTMAFFTGCDKNPIHILVQIDGNVEYEQLDKNIPLLDRFDIIDEYLCGIELLVYTIEKDGDGNDIIKRYNFEYNRHDVPKVKNEKTGKMEYQKATTEKGTIDLYTAKFNGASGVTLELDSPGKKVMNISFMGATTTFEYTVIAKSN